MNRRTFALCTSAALAAPFRSRADEFSNPLGVCADIGKVNVVKAAGAAYIEEKAPSLFNPAGTEAEWLANLEKIKALPIPVAGCNGFLPGNLRCTGKDADHETVLQYAETVFRRAKQVNLDFIVFGSAKTRALKAGDSAEEAGRQFVDLLKRMAPLAQANNITIAVEPLRKQECNFINTVLEGAAIVEKAGHPNIRLLCDIYHMLHNGEDPDDLRKVGPLLRHCHIAEKEKRTAPGVAGDDFRPFFAALKSVGYKGRISVEAKWTPEQLAHSFEVIREQFRTA